MDKELVEILPEKVVLALGSSEDIIGLMLNEEGTTILVRYNLEFFLSHFSIIIDDLLVDKGLFFITGDLPPEIITNLGYTFVVLPGEFEVLVDFHDGNALKVLYGT